MSACSNSVQLVPLHPIIMSILFHHYKELIQLALEVKQMEEVRPNSEKRLAIKEEEGISKKLVRRTQKKKKSLTPKKEEPGLDIMRLSYWNNQSKWVEFTSKNLIFALRLFQSENIFVDDNETVL
jgi:hypothetical protein